MSCVVLAAGFSRRMGEPKLLLPFREDTVLSTTLRAVDAGPFGEKIVVVQKDPGRIPAGFRVLEIGQAAEAGMHASLRLGIGALKNPGSGLCVALADQPFLGPQEYEALASAWERARAEGKDLLYPEWEGRRGNPAVIGPRYLEEVSQQPDDDRGCHYLFRRHPENVFTWPVATPAFYRDLDRKEDFAHA